MRRALTASPMMLLGLVAACSNVSVSSGPAPSYSLGGTVSGLSASGLMLGNGGHTLAVSSGATSFSFGSMLTAGTAYAVTVQTQPAGELCSVSAGSGTAGAANIANVVVACADAAFSLGGTVNGLTTSGLMLADGDQTVAVAPGATTFAFPTAVAQGSDYAVTVQTQPTGLACAVTQGTGMMPSGGVATVSVTCTDQPFDLGGSISGLSTAGLVLANGADTLAVNANATNFTMPAKVAYTGQYAVKVQTQPSGLTCTVSSGAGTMPAQAVSTVVVVCADKAYVLGGSVSGLTASGLVLANDGDTDSVSVGATSFTMPTAVAYGSPYAVTVQAQPSGLTCTVSAGGGTMPAVPVNVIVTCAVPTYTIGGSISGLTASGLVLANGSDTLTVAANAALFTMPAALASAAAYDVIVRTPPAGLICTVSGGSGTVSTSDVTSVAVSCILQLSFTTPGSYTFTVPSGTTSVLIVATGGGGGGSGSSNGGDAGVVTATLSVAAGDKLALEVGGGGVGGVGGVGGGVGGGSSGVNAGTANQIIAGGGGGAGAGYSAGGGAGGPSGDVGGGGGDSTGPAGAVFTIGTNGGTADGNGGNGSVVITLNP